MSKNAAYKRRAEARHRDQWSIAPRGTPLSVFVHGIVPVETPLIALIREQVPANG